MLANPDDRRILEAIDWKENTRRGVKLVQSLLTKILNRRTKTCFVWVIKE